ncbi:MAG: hypothetical protein WAP35_04390 [Solirubrobacterales bacterium]
MNSESSATSSTTASTVAVEFGDPTLSGAVLERLVSAAAARADLTVDRLINALTVVDALVDAADSQLDSAPRHVSLQVSPGSLRLAFDGLRQSEAESVVKAASLPELGDVLTRFAESVDIFDGSAGSSLVVVLN